MRVLGLSETNPPRLLCGVYDGELPPDPQAWIWVQTTPDTSCLVQRRQVVLEADAIKALFSA